MFQLGQQDTPTGTPPAATPQTPPAPSQAPAPAPQAPATPSATPPAAAPVAPQKMSVDGREVTFEELARKHEELRSAYTRTAQEAAELKKRQSEAPQIAEQVGTVIAERLGKPAAPVEEDLFGSMAQIDVESQPFVAITTQQKIIQRQAAQLKALAEQTRELNQRMESVSTKEELGRVTGEIAWKETEKAIVAAVPDYNTNPFIRGQTLALLHPSQRDIPSAVLGGARPSEMTPDAVAKKVADMFDAESKARQAETARRDAALANNLPSGTPSRGTYVPPPVDEINKHPVGSPERAAAIAKWNRETFARAQERAARGEVGL